jgi:hypothetical protein
VRKQYRREKLSNVKKSMRYNIIEKNLGPMLLLDNMDITDPDYGELMSTQIQMFQLYHKLQERLRKEYARNDL